MDFGTDLQAEAVEKPARAPGALRGQIHMAEDFDEMPDDLLAAMEAEA